MNEIQKKIAIKNLSMSWFHEPFFVDSTLIVADVAALFTYARCNLPLIYKGTYLLIVISHMCNASVYDFA